MEITPEYLLLSKYEVARLLSERRGYSDLLIDRKRKIAFHFLRTNDTSRPWVAQVSLPFDVEIDLLNYADCVIKLEFTMKFTTNFRTRKDIVNTLITYGHWVNNVSNTWLELVNESCDSGEIVAAIYWGGKGYGKLRYISVVGINPAPGLPEVGEPETVYYLDVLEADSQAEKTYRLDRLQVISKEMVNFTDLLELKRTTLMASDLNRERARKARPTKLAKAVRPLEICDHPRSVVESLEPRTPNKILKAKAHVWRYEKEYLRCDDGLVYTYRRESWGYSFHRHEIVRPELTLAEVVYWDQLIDTQEWANSDIKGMVYMKSKKAAIGAFLEGKLYFRPQASESNKAWRKMQRERRLNDDILPYSIKSFRKHRISPGEVGLSSLQPPWRQIFDATF